MANPESPSDFEKIEDQEARPSLLGDFWYFLRHNKKWWLLPILITRDGVRVDYVAGQPSLWIKSPEPGQFFITWCRLPDREFVPYNGSSIEPFVVEERGGDPFRVPRACLVPPSAAAEIVHEFLLSRQRSDAVAWESWYEMELPLPGAKW